MAKINIKPSRATMQGIGRGWSTFKTFFAGMCFALMLVFGGALYLHSQKQLVIATDGLPIAGILDPHGVALLPPDELALMK